ncbi:MAG TPA: MFS transporter [Solirubrobacteraceae bacterium]|nr:MFS transporter [Solirubrobacteraceae bacterium]
MRRQRATVLATFFSQGAMFASWAAHIPEVKLRIGVSDGLLGTILLATPVGAAVAMLITGRLLTRFGSERLIRPCMIGYCVAAVLVGETRSAWALAAVLLAWGAFGGSLDVSVNTQAVAVEHAQQRRLMPLFHGGWSIGALTGAGTGSAAVALHISLVAQMLVMAIPVLVANQLLSRAMLDDRADRADRADARADAPTGEPLRRRIQIPRAVLFLGLIALATMLCEGAALDWSAVYIRGLQHGSAGISGLGYVAFAVAMASVRVGGSKLLDRIPARRFLPGLAALATVAVAAALASGHAWAAIVGFGCLGAGTGLVIPTVFTAAGRITGLAPGGAITAVSACGWIGYMGGPPLIGQLAQLGSLRSALLIIPAFTVLIALGAARLTATTQATTPPETQATTPPETQATTPPAAPPEPELR